MMYVILWLLVLAMITGGLKYFLGSIALLYMAAALFIAGAIVWSLQ